MGLPKLCQVLLLLTLVSVYNVKAQRRSVYFKLKGIQPDTIRKQLIFRYRISNLAPKDSLSIDLVNGQKAPFRLRVVYGDIGTVLTDGKNKKIYWDPVADRQRIDNGLVEIRFVVKTVSGQGLTRWQAIRLGRWAVGGGLTAYTLLKGISIINEVGEYNRQDQPNNTPEKNARDVKRTDIQNQQKNFYRLSAMSATALLVNLTWSAIQSRHKLKPIKLSVIGENQSIGVAYNL